MAFEIAGDFPFELFYEERPLGPWSDNAHMSGQNIPQLRKLVQTCPAENPSDRCRARVPFFCANRPRRNFRVGTHRSELDDKKWLAVQAYSFLDEKNRTAGRQFNDGSKNQSKRQSEQKNKR